MLKWQTRVKGAVTLDDNQKLIDSVYEDKNKKKCIMQKQE